jgi:hypothetical protein
MPAREEKDAQTRCYQCKKAKLWINEARAAIACSWRLKMEQVSGIVQRRLLED